MAWCVFTRHLRKKVSWRDLRHLWGDPLKQDGGSLSWVGFGWVGGWSNAKTFLDDTFSKYD